MFEIKNVTKSYQTNKGRRYVFRDLSFEIPPDRNVGLIGRNGSGKSTLMRIIGGADIPDKGFVRSDKNISWPVGLSGGFQGSLSARDNVKFVCRIYGALGSEMKEKVDYVRDFAEIGMHFDEPIKTYSAGMRSRVAFGLSMAFDFDYYLIDEVLSVGDSHFKKKCGEVFQSKIGKANLILVSHSMVDVRRLCNMIILVRNGDVEIFEDVEEGIAAYQS